MSASAYSLDLCNDELSWSQLVRVLFKVNEALDVARVVNDSIFVFVNLTDRKHRDTPFFEALKN